MGPIWLRAKMWSRMPPALSATSVPTTSKPIAKPIHLNPECLTVSAGTVSAAEMAPLAFPLLLLGGEAGRFRISSTLAGLSASEAVDSVERLSGADSGFGVAIGGRSAGDGSG